MRRGFINLIGHTEWPVHRLKLSKKSKKNKNALYLSVNVFSTKVLIGDINFSPQLETGPPFLRGHPNHVKVKPLAVQREYLHFSVI